MRTLRWLWLVAGLLVASALLATLAAADTPVLTLPPNVTVFTTGSSAAVEFTASASDNGTPVAPACVPASGSLFPGGTTSVTCTADNGLGDPIASGSFDVTVVTPPVLVLPADITVGEDNANVSFGVSASDQLGAVTAACSVGSPHLFPLGTTTVTCSAARPEQGAGSASGSFTVTVLDTTPPPVPALTGLTGTINDSTPTFTFTSSGAAGFTCSLAGPTALPGAECPSPTTTPTLADGDYVFSVAAHDDSGNTSAAQSTSFTVDTTPPAAPTLGGPSGTIADRTPTFTFGAAGAASYVCAFDDVTPTASCVSPRTAPAPLADGAHTFSVAARDAVANTSAVSTTALVVDTTPPGTSITTSIPALTSSRTISLGFSATEAGATFECSLDGGPFAGCGSPAELAALADGSHTFSVRAADAVGNTDASPASTSWVVDATPPELSPVGSLGKSVEADGPGGTRVTFAISGSDDGVALLPGAIACAPVSGSLFPVGTTTVACHAADQAGNLGVLTFTVPVHDTTAPSINAPSVSFTATDAAGIASTAPAVAAYLTGISASDLVSTPTLTTNAPPVFPIGVTTLVVTARDVAGNVASKSVIVTVLQPGKPAPAPDLIPPRPVTSAKATAGDRRIILTWRHPASDVARVEVRRGIVGEDGSEKPIYSGLAQTFASKGLRNGVTYRFVLVAFDAAGNSSTSVVVNASPRAPLLARPLPGAKVSSPPLLRWTPVPSTYFNVQLYRGGVKILSAWPAHATLQLTAGWSYKSRKLLLKPGVYTWYVWPGLGARAAVRYGDLLGRSSFVVVAAKKKTKR